MNNTISVVTVVLNNMLGLIQTIKSVLSQSIALEYIVIDGGSIDGTINVLQEYQEQISYSISEPDSGVYNAMNKAIEKAQGDYIIFLNAGDFFYSPESLRFLLTNSSNEDIIYGDLIVKTGEKEFIIQYPEVLDFNFFVEDTLPHPSTLIRRQLFLQYGLYNEDYRICADWVFFLDVIAKHTVSYKHVENPIAVFFYGGLSSNVENVMFEKTKYLEKAYCFYFRGYLKHKEYERKIVYLKNSRLVRLISKVLPNKITDKIYK